MTRRASTTLLLAGLALVLSACGASPAAPPAVAGLPLSHLLEGTEARAAINRLHGKAIPARDAFVAHYEQDGAVAMLYVTRAWITPLAWWQFLRMVKGIEAGGANREGRFTHLKAREQDGLTLYSALGLGQVHYFYRSDATIVWLAADPHVARAAMAETVRAVR